MAMKALLGFGTSFNCSNIMVGIVNISQIKPRSSHGAPPGRDVFSYLARFQFGKTTEPSRDTEQTGGHQRSIKRHPFNSRRFPRIVSLPDALPKSSRVCLF